MARSREGKSTGFFASFEQKIVKRNKTWTVNLRYPPPLNHLLITRARRPASLWLLGKMIGTMIHGILNYLCEKNCTSLRSITYPFLFLYGGMDQLTLSQTIAHPNSTCRTLSRVWTPSTSPRPPESLKTLLTKGKFRDRRRCPAALLLLLSVSNSNF